MIYLRKTYKLYVCLGKKMIIQRLDLGLDAPIYEYFLDPNQESPRKPKGLSRDPQEEKFLELAQRYHNESLIRIGSKAPLPIVQVTQGRLEDLAIQIKPGLYTIPKRFQNFTDPISE